MTHRYHLFVLLLFLGMAWTSRATAEVYSGNFFISLGGFRTSDSFSKAFDSDTQVDVGISFDVKEEAWPVSLAFESSYQYGESDIPSPSGTDHLLFVRSDMGLGVKHIFQGHKTLKPFVLGGAYLVRLYSKKENRDEIETALGYFAGCGINVCLTEQFTMGAQWKYSRAHMRVLGESVDAGGHHLALLIGVSF